ncbi:MAG: DUF1854 domain-containing protein [Clostridia bacterium]|nr:DUF1854 domain-containing protein [Clostridia bacterium]
MAANDKDNKTTKKDDAPAKEAPKKNAILEEDEDMDAGDLILANERVSIPLNMQNAKFTRSQGNLVSLTLKKDDGEEEFFERVVVLRAFPITNPSEFLSVREPDSKKMGRGKEIGMIRYMSDFDEATQKLLLEELDRRYFSPQILKIHSVKEKFGYSYWDSETTAGHVTFILNNPFSNIRLFEDGRIFINDFDGNSFEIADPKKLDAASYRKIELYL